MSAQRAGEYPMLTDISGGLEPVIWPPGEIAADSVCDVPPPVRPKPQPIGSSARGSSQAASQPKDRKGVSFA
jgi:hypothetical protein